MLATDLIRARHLRSLPHFLVDAKDIDRAAEGEVDEGYSEFTLITYTGPSYFRGIL